MSEDILGAHFIHKLIILFINYTSNHNSQNKKKWTKHEKNFECQTKSGKNKQDQEKVGYNNQQSWGKKLLVIF